MQQSIQNVSSSYLLRACNKQGSITACVMRYSRIAFNTQIYSSDLRVSSGIVIDTVLMALSSVLEDSFSTI